MGMARIGEGEEKAADLGLSDDRQNVGEWHIAIMRPLVITPADMQPNPVARNIFECRVDRRDDAFDKAEEIAERTVLVGEMALEREVWAIELQQEAAADDRLVFPFERCAECREIGFLAVVIFVLHRSGDDPGRGCGQERFDKMRAGLVECRLEIGAFGLDRGRPERADLADRFGRPHVADRLSDGQLLLHRLLEYRVTQGIGAGPALPRTAKATHPVADVKKEALALLLAIVADVGARIDLLRDDSPQRRLAQSFELARIDGFAPRPAHKEPGELRRARQAAGMGRQDPVFAAAHRHSYRTSDCYFAQFTAEAERRQPDDREQAACRGSIRSVNWNSS